MTTAPHPASPARPTALRPHDVGVLIETGGYPCVSVLLATRPADVMTPGDSRRLGELVAAADAQLEDAHPGTARSVRQRLHELAEAASWHGTERGLALFASQAVAKAVLLPQPVRDRAVVEPTFATRDLVLAMHRTPPHLVLLLHGTCAHLYEAMGRRLAEITPPDGPMTMAGAQEAVGVLRDPEAEEDQITDFLARVDRWLGDHRRTHPSPLVLAGSGPMLDRFAVRSRHLQRLAGRLGPDEVATPARLASASALLLDQYLYSRRTEALGLLAETERRHPDDVVRGAQRCLRVARSGRPQMLLVEEGYRVAGAAHRGQAPVHDVVDDLIEVVIGRGGQLALVADGDLADAPGDGPGDAPNDAPVGADGHRVALIMRS